MYSILPEPSRSISRIIIDSLSSSSIRPFIISLNYWGQIVPSQFASALLKICSRPSFYGLVSSCETVYVYTTASSLLRN